MSGRSRQRKAPSRPRAVALGYDPSRDPAPRVLAGGAGETARRILEIASAKGIPVRQDPGLLELLARLDIGEAIPVEVYQAVAEILVLLYRLEQEKAPLRARSGSDAAPSHGPGRCNPSTRPVLPSESSPGDGRPGKP